MKQFLFSLSLIAFLGISIGYAQQPGHKTYIAEQTGKNFFPLVADGKAAPVYTGTDEYPGAMRAVKSLIGDIKSVTSVAPGLITDIKGEKQIVLIGTLGKNAAIDDLVKLKKLNVTGIAGKWETYLIQVVPKPFPGVESALVIAGSDKRGTIYGAYDVSAQIGVSPWYWWADVPVKTRKELYVMPGRYTDGEPAVKYRGIFINDEAPAFSGWAHEKFGGVNHQMYEKMFELILRLKGNYLWPAMWGNAFNDDDKLNPVLADEYGIVMGTSHHEPMDRAQQEWKRYGKGDWNYETNKDVLRNFWRKGMENMGTKETIVTVGMRGDGDMPMTEGSNIKLLEGIVSDQRDIVRDVLHKDPAEVPQMWALYKEVQDYYDKGMRVPDDITLLLCDDNWGNIRKLPALTAKARKGGYGIYYHFDYVGGPRNYKWLNTNPISKAWEQMHLAYEYKARQIWVVNVGDLKPMEFPISFFLDYAWNPEKMPAMALKQYAIDWASQQFGPQYAAQIARILTLYTKYNGRRKPELLDASTYSLTNYREFELVVNNYNNLRNEAEVLYERMPDEYRDAYYQLVMHPVEACANLNEMYYEAAKNKLYAQQGRAATNKTAENVKRLFAKDKDISAYYNKTLAGGKWDHMMDQTHIGYTYWQQPPIDKMPAVNEIELPDESIMQLTVPGTDKFWHYGQTVKDLPVLFPSQTSGTYIDLFNQGKKPFYFLVQANTAPYVNIMPSTTILTDQQRVWLNVDWAKAPKKLNRIPVTVIGPKGTTTVILTADNRPAGNLNVHAQKNGYISIEAEHYTKAVGGAGVTWTTIPEYGRTLSGVTVTPVTAARVKPASNTPHLEYQISLKDTGTVSVEMYVSPTLDFKSQKGLFYAVSMDNDKPQRVDINTNADGKNWDNAVSDNIRKMLTRHHIKKAGIHTLKFWMVDPAVVLQKVVVNAGGLKPSYLGPPEN